MFAFCLIILTAFQDNLLDDAPARDSETSRQVWVVQDGLEVLVEPDPAAIVTQRLRKKQRLEVRGASAPGWLRIAPPPGSFSWIERTAIEVLDDERAQVSSRVAAVRPGAEEASLPSGIWTILHKGDVVRLVDRPPLVIRQPGDERRVWYAIEPPADEVRYVRSDGTSDFQPFENSEQTDDRALDDALATRPARDTRLASMRLPRLDPSILSPGPPIAEAGIRPGFLHQLRRIEQAQRAALASPLESWSLDAIERDYAAMLAGAQAAEERRAVESRQAQLARQKQLAKAARALRQSLDRAAALDAEVDAARRDVARASGDRQTPFEAEGLLQSSSTFVDGQAAHLLIDDQGRTAAYVLVQPGVSAREFLARRVGIRGESRYNATLKARVITARQIEALGVD